jgi:hypothetical protein
VQLPGVTSITRLSVKLVVDRAEERAEPEASVIKLGCAGWLPHFRMFVRGCLKGSGVDRVIGHVNSSGVPLAVVSPSLLHDYALLAVPFAG